MTTSGNWKFGILRNALQFQATAVLIAAFAASAVAAPPQRQGRIRTSPPDISTQINALGILPDEIRSILLIYAGRSVSKSDADKLEADVRKEPENIDDRLKLIGYYDWNGRSPLDRLQLRAHVLWMVKNHPEHPAVGEPSLRDLRDDPEGNSQITTLWYEKAVTCEAPVPVLKSAEKFFFGKDPAQADRLIHCLSAKEPNNSQWANELAQLYRMSGIPGESFADPTQRTLYGYDRVLELVRAPAARQALAGDMAAAAFKVGDFRGAATLAAVYLQSTDRNAIQRANTILGRVALRSGDIAASKQYLLDSSSPAAGREIALYGPTMALARELLEKDERDAVLKYLDNCLTLWPRGETTVRSWIADIQNGSIPNFGTHND